ncbi:MAG: hypothetical protein CMJ78_24730 [Planctomycetaceae bacterium]|nr:hypothetical protein [Planctomycetaceae bacterium]
MEEEQAAHLPTADQFAAVTEEDEEQVPCPDCGEMLRKELVRCWQCGAFLREDIAERYRDMQASPAPITYSQLPEGDDFLAGKTGSAPTIENATTPEGDEDDFELAPGVDSTQADEPRVPLAPAAEATPPLAESPPAPAPAAPAAEAPASQDDLETIPLLKPEEPAAESPLDTPAPTEEKAEAAPAEKKPFDLLEEAPAEGEAKKQDDSEESKEKSSEAKEKKPTQSDDGAPAHSVATGGDALLDIALTEEKEAEKRQKTRAKRRKMNRSGFIVFCPNGHQVEVKEKHRGMTGRCPKCKAAFHVPAANWDTKDKPEGEGDDGRQLETEQLPGGRFNCWMKDMRLHTVDPSKLKLKAGSLEKNFEASDIAFAEEELLLASMTKKGSLFGGGGGKPDEVRDEVLKYLAVPDHPTEDVPAGKHTLFTKDQISEIGVVQPAAYAHESMFAGIAVFGEGRIAVRMPRSGDGTELQFVSFGLTEFRKFAQLVNERFGIEGLGSDCGIPFEDEKTKVSCHYSEDKFEALSLEKLEYYESDERITLDTVGRKCQECGLVVSEDSRKKEKIGGANGKAIAKAKCPKCTNKFGSITLFQISAVDELDTEPKIVKTDEEEGEKKKEEESTS